MNEKDQKNEAAHRQETEPSPSAQKRARAWESHRFRSNLLFAALVIFIFVIITNLDQLGGKLLSLLSLFSPLLLGVLLALLLNIPLSGIERLLGKLNRRVRSKKPFSETAVTRISLILTFILAILLVYFVGNSVAPEIVSSFKSIVGSFEDYYPRALAYLEDWGFNTAELKNILSKLDLNDLWKIFGSNAGTILNTALHTFNGLFSAVTNFVTAVIFSIYILANRGTLKRQIGKLLDAYLKPGTARKVKGVGMLVVRTFSNFFSGQCLEAVLLGIIFFVAMTVGRFPYAVVISVIIAVTALVPYVGAFIGCIIGALLIFMHSPLRALAFVIMFLVIQQLENHLLYPRVVGTSVGLPAIWTFAALIAGGALYGVAGMILFIPAASVLYTLLKNGVNARLKAKAEKAAESPSSDGAKPSAGEDAS